VVRFISSSQVSPNTPRAYSEGIDLKSRLTLDQEIEGSNPSRPANSILSLELNMKAP
jgi:hypothetical protein